MSQLSFLDAEYAGKRKKRRREVFTKEGDQAAPWKAVLRASVKRAAPPAWLLSTVFCLAGSFHSDAGAVDSSKLGAICDFAYARLFEVGQSISSDPKSKTCAASNSVEGQKVCVHRSNGLYATYVRTPYGLGVIRASIDAMRIYEGDRPRSPLLSRLGLADDGSQVVHTGCDRIDLDLQFDGESLRSVQVVNHPN